MDRFEHYEGAPRRQRTTELAIARGDSLLLRYKRALEGLTPGGSEFVDEPERCAEMVRESLASRMRVIVSLTKRNRELEDANG